MRERFIFSAATALECRASQGDQELLKLLEPQHFDQLQQQMKAQHVFESLNVTAIAAGEQDGFPYILLTIKTEQLFAAQMVGLNVLIDGIVADLTVLRKMHRKNGHHHFLKDMALDFCESITESLQDTRGEMRSLAPAELVDQNVASDFQQIGNRLVFADVVCDSLDIPAVDHFKDKLSSSSN